MINKDIEIYKKLDIDYEQRGGVVMISITDAFRFVTFCSMNNVGIYGVDAFRLEKSAIYPLLDWTRDYSQFSNLNNFAEESTRQTFELLQTMQQEEGHSLFLEFTL